jgi:sugar lactone lactonase YvrE
VRLTYFMLRDFSGAVQTGPVRTWRGWSVIQWLLCGLPVMVASMLSAETVAQGARVTLTVSAEGSQPFNYQWFKDGTSISGATSSSFTIAAATAGDKGTYTATVSNSVGSATSTPLSLDITQASNTTITTQPSAQTIPTGHIARFVAASSTGSGTWQVSTDNGATWRNLTDDGTYSGTNTGTLTVSGVTSAMSGYQYRYTSGSTSSSAVTLSVVSAVLSQPTGVAMSSSGSLVVADTTLNTISTVTTGGSLTVLAGSGGSAGTSDGSGSGARFNQPRGVAVDAAGNVYVADSANATIRKISSAGTVSTIAGSTSVRGNADGTSATFSSPTGVALDSAGNLYVTDSANHTVRKITPAGVVSTLAGGAGATGTADGAGTAARFNRPTGVAVDAAGNVFVADTSNNTIRKITPAGVVSTLAGLVGVAGASDGSGVDARFNQPAGLTIDGAGNLYVADAGNSAIRKVTPAGYVSTFAGLPTIAGLLDGRGLEAWFNQPQGLAVDSSGNVWVADTGNDMLRKVTSDGSVSTLSLTAAGSDSPTTAPSTPSTPAPSPSPAPSSGGGGGGGGGGAPSTWFLAALAALALMRLTWGGGTCAPRRFVRVRSARTNS